jgi:hypothetical protein
MNGRADALGAHVSARERTAIETTAAFFMVMTAPELPPYFLPLMGSCADGVPDL